MKLSQQIKKYREKQSLTQDELAQKIYVSRQSISNWENERSYPDIHNLLLLSVLFNVSLDELVKGEVEEMKEKISHSSINRYSNQMLVFTLLGALSVGPSLFLPSYWWIVPPLLLWSIVLYNAIQIEKIKKDEDIQTMKEIIAFTDGKDGTPIRKKRKKKDYLIEKAIIVLVFSIIVSLIALLSTLPYYLIH